MVKLSVMALLLGLSGCASYQAGDGSNLAFSTIRINPVQNQSQAPQATQVINHDLREYFIQNGRVAVVNSGAEVNLDVTLTRYDRRTIATNSQDTGLARKYAVELSARASLKGAGGEPVYFENRPVTATVDIFLDSGQTNAETNAIPLISKKLAEAIANEVLHGW